MNLPGESGTTTYLFLAALLFVTGWLLFRAHRRLGPRNPPSRKRRSSGRQPARAASTHAAEAPAEFYRWEVSMHETARELKAELDTKMRAVQYLMESAHQLTERMESAIDRAQRASERLAAQLAHARPAETEPAPAAAPVAAEPVAAEARAPADPPAAQASARDARYEEIYQLADGGLDAARIARQVGSTRGEVELILSLRCR